MPSSVTIKPSTSQELKVARILIDFFIWIILWKFYNVTKILYITTNVAIVEWPFVLCNISFTLFSFDKFVKLDKNKILLQKKSVFNNINLMYIFFVTEKIARMSIERWILQTLSLRCAWSSSDTQPQAMGTTIYTNFVRLIK